MPCPFARVQCPFLLLVLALLVPASTATTTATASCLIILIGQVVGVVHEILFILVLVLV